VPGAGPECLHPEPGRHEHRTAPNRPERDGRCR
jgi:hypothetical protein